MRMKEIKDKIQLAMTSVDNVPEPFKLKAFEVILDNLLKGSTSTTPSNRVPEEKDEFSKASSSVMDRIEKLAKTIGLQASQLEDVFQFEKDEPIFIGRVNGTEAERQVQVCRLIMLASKEVYGQEWQEGSFLWKILKNYGIGSLDNLAKNLKNRENEFRMMGQKKGRKYKLTELGRQNAIESLRQLAA